MVVYLDCSGGYIDQNMREKDMTCQCQFPGCHTTLRLHKMEQLGNLGKGMKTTCFIFATASESIIISK